MRTTFIISLEHKILSIHRPFLARPSRATTYALSRKRVIEAARAILREAPQARDIRLWTAIYHISVASFSLTLELYEQLKSPSADNQAIRNEIQQALPTLEGLKAASAIAERGLGLVTPLLADEKRMREEGGSFRQKDRRKVSRAFVLICLAKPGAHTACHQTKPAPTRTKSGAITQAAPPGVSPGQSTTATTQAPLASPAASLDLLVNNEAAASAASVSPSMEPPFYPFAHAGSYDSFAAGNLPPHLFGSTGGAYPPHPLQIPPWMFHEHYLQSHLSGGDDGVSTAPSPFPATQLGWPNGPMTGALGMGLSVGLQHAPFAWDWPAQGDSGMTEDATPNAA